MGREKTIAYLSGVAVAALITPSSAGAQQMLDPIVVEGQADVIATGTQGNGDPASREAAIGPVNGYVAGSSTAGSKTATPVTQIPASVSVIGRDELEDRGVTKIDEALRYTAGVLGQPFGADNDTNWVYIRGFDATQTGVYQDGLQHFSYGFGGFYADPFALERIEVLRGAASVLYGGSNPGGVLNYVTKHPDGERLRYMETGINDAGNAWVGIDIGDKASPALDYRVTARVSGGELYTDFEDDFRGFIAPSFTWHVDQNTDFTLLANYTFLDETHGGGGFLPYFGTVVPLEGVGRIDPKANFTEPGLDDYQRRQFNIGYELEHRVTPDWTVRQNFRYGHSELQETALYAFGYSGFLEKPGAVTPGNPNPDYLQRINFGHDTTVDTVLVDNQLEGRLQTGLIEHRVLFGADVKWFQLDQMQASTPWPINGSPISPTDPVYGEPQGARVPYLDEVLTQTQLGLYVQDQLRFGGGWIVTLNGRYDFVDLDRDDRLKANADYGSNEEAASGRAGLAYEFANGLTPYASAATFFNPLIGTGPDGAFVPETGEQYEVGLKYAPKWFDGLFTVAWFDLTKQNVLTGSVLVGQSQIGEVNSQGIELEAKANITKSLKLTASLTALDLEVTKSDNNSAATVGKQPYLIPEVMGGIALDYTFREGMLNGFSIGGGVRYLGESYADALNQHVVPDAILFDAKIGYQEGNWGVDLNVTNLMDEEYVSGCQTTLSCSYGEGRVVKLRTHVTW